RLGARWGRGLGDDRPGLVVPRKEGGDGMIAAQQELRDLDQKPGAVSALAVGVEPAPVREAGEGLNAKVHRLVAKLRGGDETHAASRAAVGEIPRPGKA